MPLQRKLAVVLAVIGALWGLLCLPFLILGDTLRALLVFGPGYAVTIGYVFRACATPPRWCRLGIWTLSALVQGTWLFVMLGLFLLEGGLVKNGPFRAYVFEFAILSWWKFAFLASVYGAVADWRLQPAEPGAAPDAAA